MMFNDKSGVARALRLLQIVFLSFAVWFIFWGHIYDMLYWNMTFYESLVQNFFPHVLLYTVFIFGVIAIELLSKKRNSYPIENLSSNTHEKIVAKKGETKITKSKQMPSDKIGLTFVLVGVLLLLYSMVSSSFIFAVIGLGLTFWGAIFFFVRPNKFVNVSVLESSVAPLYAMIDRIIDDMNYQGKPVYLPSFTKEKHLPDSLGGLKEMVVFISSSDSIIMPSIEELAKKKFFVKSPDGISIKPPGYELVKLFEQQIGTLVENIEQDALYESLPTIIVKNLELASDFKINDEQHFVHIKITGSFYEGLYSSEKNLESVRSLGCPLVSAVICALVKKTGKRMTINKSLISPELETIEIWLQTIEG